MFCNLLINQKTNQKGRILHFGFDYKSKKTRNKIMHFTYKQENFKFKEE